MDFLDKIPLVLASPVGSYALNEVAKRLNAFGPKSERRSDLLQKSGAALGGIGAALVAIGSGSLSGDILNDAIVALILVVPAVLGPEQLHRLKKRLLKK